MVNGKGKVVVINLKEENSSVAQIIGISCPILNHEIETEQKV